MLGVIQYGRYLLGVGDSTIGESLGDAFSPNRVLPGYISNSNSIIIPIAVLPGLSVEEANSVSGNWIDIFQAICIANHNWLDIYPPIDAPATVDSWNNRNMNAKSSKFQYGVGELNTFLEHFTISYGIIKLVDEN